MKEAETRRSGKKKACQIQFEVVQKREEGGGGGSEGAWISLFCSVHHEAEEGGEAVQGGVEELSTGLPAIATTCL